MTKLEQLAERLARSLLRARGCKTEGPLDEIQFGNIALKDALAIIEDFPALRAAGEGWRPIETAPNDVVVVTDGCYCLCAYQNAKGWASGFSHGDMHVTVDLTPTHWRPLPAPPTAKLEGRNDG